MPSVTGYSHVLQASRTNNDSAAAEAVTEKFRVLSPKLPTQTTTYHRDIEESGRESDLPESAPTPLSVEAADTFPLVADDHSLAFWGYYALHGGAASTVAQIGTTAIYEHVVDGPGATISFRAPYCESLGKPGTSDNALNKDLVNALVERLEISGQRRGRINLGLTLRAGYLADGGAGTTIGSFQRHKILNFGHARLITSDTLGFLGGAFAATAFGTSAVTNAVALTRTELPATAVNLTDHILSFTIRVFNRVSVDESYAAGQVNGDNAGVVEHSGQWIPSVGEPFRDVELEMALKHDGDAAGVIKGLMDEIHAGTRRAWELWLAHQEDVGSGAFASVGCRLTLGSMHPVSVEEVPRGFGDKALRVVYRSGWDVTANKGWRYLAAVKNLSVAIGA